MPINCSNCRWQLQPPPGGATQVRCANCRTVNAVNAYTPPAPSQNPAVDRRKRAVICGISYRRNTSQPLERCIEDAKRMKQLLVNRFNFPDSSVRMLTDEQNDITQHPTKENIRNALRWLMQGVGAGDSLVFHFSGNGLRLKDYDGNKIIGYQQMLRPLDHVLEGSITDAEINETIVRPLPAGAKLHATIDSCSSGTMLNLPFICSMQKNGNFGWKNSRHPNINEGRNGGEVICFSGCDDNQTGAVAQALSRASTTPGAMTSAFIKAIERGRAHTYGELLNTMRAFIQNPDDNSGNGVVSYLNMVLTGGSFSKQEPQLSADPKFDVYGKQFSL